MREDIRVDIESSIEVFGQTIQRYAYKIGLQKHPHARSDAVDLVSNLE